MEHEVIVAPHGSSKHDDKYMRTMPSVMTKLKKVACKSTPKSAVEIVSKKAGGVLSAPSAGALPRGRQQVKDIRRASISEHVDPLWRMNNLIQGYIISIDNDLSVGDNTSDVVNVPV